MSMISLRRIVSEPAPVERNAYIFGDCSVRALIVDGNVQGPLEEAMKESGQKPGFLVAAEGRFVATESLSNQAVEHGADPAGSVGEPADRLAYILYTSGSTGRPKGVMLSHLAAISFIDWCSQELGPSSADRFSSHAPFHFDLSILDLYVPIKHGGTLVLVDEVTGKDAVQLAGFISDKKISVWYSTPSILSFMAHYGRLGSYDYSALKQVLFAGEVFPPKHFQELRKFWPKPAYYNLYGPTETNVCTYYRVPNRQQDSMEPFPIGETCSHLRIRILDADGQEVPAGSEGELCVSGPGVMLGYWNLPERTASAFWTDAEGAAWYRTGDIAYQAQDGNYIFKGRRDRMVKRRGYRIELGEIEAALYRHPRVSEAAVLASPDEESGVRINAFLGCGAGKHPNTIEMKKFCVDTLPAYMTPDRFHFQEALPRTLTDKIDYQKLNRL